MSHVEVEQLTEWLWCLRTRTGARLVAEAPPAVADRLVDPGDRLRWEHDAAIVAAPEIACCGHGAPLRGDAAARLAELAR